jgi:hypothetical protein
MSDLVYLMVGIPTDSKFSSSGFPPEYQGIYRCQISYFRRSEVVPCMTWPLHYSIVTYLNPIYPELAEEVRSLPFYRDFVSHGTPEGWLLGKTPGINIAPGNTGLYQLLVPANGTKIRVEGPDIQTTDATLSCPPPLEDESLVPPLFFIKVAGP